MKKNNYKLVLLGFIICVAFLICGCGLKETPEPTPAPTAAPTPEPTPEPTPTPEPVLTPDSSAFLEGKEINTYQGMFDKYEAFEVLGISDGTWRGKEVSFEDKYVPIDEFCDKLQIGVFEDPDDGTVYCTAATGDWELPSDRHVAVMMYHGVTSSGGPGANLFMPTEDMRAQIEYLLDNGYTPIWFEDLWNLDNIEKPVILTYDDGWANLYTNLMPLIEEYNVKVTVFVNTKDLPREEHGNHMSGPEMMEMYETGLVSMQSHCVKHLVLSGLSYDEQNYELYQSMLDITRFFKKAPLALAYPEGGKNDDTLSLMSKYYRFGALMTTSQGYYNTSDDPYLVARFFPQRGIAIDTYSKWLDMTFEN